MSDSITHEIVGQVSELPDELQRLVLDFVRNLKASFLAGVPGKQLLQFAGTIPPEDLQVMREAIEAECEQVDVNEWQVPA